VAKILKNFPENQLTKKLTKFSAVSVSPPAAATPWLCYC